MRTTTNPPLPLKPAVGAAARMALLALFGSVPAFAATFPAPLAPPDAYGYELHDQTTGACPFTFVDLGAGGTALSFPAPGDDEGALFSPSRAFELYGRPVTAFVVSTNGYLAATGSLAAEDGRDYSNDAPIPAVPAYLPVVSGAATVSFPARLAVFHDDLALGTGSVRSQEFASCPRDSGTVSAEACTVVQWSGVSRVGSAEVLTFEAILYHSSFSLAFQVQASSSSDGGSATLGIQDFDAKVGLQYGANEPGRIPAGTAVCFFDPRHPAGGPRADLALSGAAKLAPASAGDLVSYGVSVRNGGPSEATGASVAAPFPPELEWVTDTCGGAFATGIWAVGALPTGGSAECLVTARVLPGTIGTVTHTFAVSGPEPDPDNANDLYSVVLEVLAPADDGDGVPAATEDAYPGGDGAPAFAAGDGNADGTADSTQSNVATLPMASGNGWLTVELLGGPCSALETVSALAESAVSALDPAYDFPAGLVSFRIPCAQGSASVRVWYHGLTSIPIAYRKYGPPVPGAASSSWYSLAGVTVGSSRNVPTASFALSDGQVGDDTGLDGVIVDQGGPGQLAADAAAIPAAGVPGLGLLAALTLAAGAWAIRRS